LQQKLHGRKGKTESHFINVRGSSVGQVAAADILFITN
jgi:hypothetical protein